MIIIFLMLVLYLMVHNLWPMPLVRFLMITNTRLLNPIGGMKSNGWLYFICLMPTVVIDKQYLNLEDVITLVEKKLKTKRMKYSRISSLLYMKRTQWLETFGLNYSKLRSMELFMD